MTETGDQKFTFEQLIEREEAAFAHAAPKPAEERRRTIAGLAADEPWVAFSPDDRFGLALSGGGIRSASFNLGVLQALASRQVLDEVHYLSTVSGGGYIGGFWTALRLRGREELVAEREAAKEKAKAAAEVTQKTTAALEQALEAQATPVSEPSSAVKVCWRNAWRASRVADRATQKAKFAAERVSQDRRRLGLDVLARSANPLESEPKEIRHVRQFGQFLIPRVGFMRSETWTAILAVLMGMIPTLLMTVSFIGAAAATFVLVHAALFPSREFNGVAVGVFSLVLLCAIHLISEWSWLRSQNKPKKRALAYAALAAAIVSALQLCATVALLSFVAPSFDVPAALRLLLPHHEYAANWQLGLPVALLAMPAAIVISVRVLLSRRSSSQLADFLDRLSSRAIAIALVWAIFVVVWEAARAALTKRFALQLGGTGLISGGLFLWFRDWLSKKPDESRLNTFLGTALSWLQPLLPRVMAFVAALATMIGVVVGFQALLVDLNDLGESTIHENAAATVLVALGTCVVTFVGLGLVTDTSALGLHGFYRSRIARAFLGARNAQFPFPLTQQQDDDDFRLEDTQALGAPIHLVCCAANHVQGDLLQSLGRGARSVALSPWGVSLGGFARRPGDLSIASALTASAAAFNSQMGAISLQFGIAVSFLMTAFNLRLGLWVDHPRAKNVGKNGPVKHWLRLMSEAIGLTRAELATDAAAPERLEKEKVPSLHLSDGGHFDNLGLYELVRRHCRYVLVSDASADPEVAFDDLGNAIRRVREDFGVEIEIDVAPLRPVDGLSRQHVVVGIIHYDRARNDTGTLVYLKPTFVGGEPPDVMHYRERNAKFPHQGTADQFYDDVQWESYRRLGEHIATVATPADPSWKTKPHRANALFLSLRQKWHAFPADHTATFLEFTNRCSALETQVRETAPDWFAAELFPELRVVLGPSKVYSLTSKELTSVVGWVMQIAQLMEDVWVGSRLDDFASHPLNEGWMAYFHRWTNAPSFRMWWPILRPIYSDGFRNFMKREFNLNMNDPDAAGRERERHRPGATLDLVTSPAEWSDDAAALMGLDSFPRSTVRYALWLENPSGDTRFEFGPIPVASLSHTVAGTTAKWKSSQLKVPPWLVGGGIVARFLDRLISYFEKETDVTHLEVDAGEEQEEVIAFYKSRGFTWSNAAMQTLTRGVKQGTK